MKTEWQPIGKRRKRITIESPAEASDGAGGSVTTWTTLCDTWAIVTPVSGSERLQAKAVQADVSHTINIRYRSGLTPKCRVLLNTRVLRIVSVRDLAEVHRELELSCLEVLSEAGG